MDLRIDAGRLWQSLMDLARIGYAGSASERSIASRSVKHRMDAAPGRRIGE